MDGALVYSQGPASAHTLHVVWGSFVLFAHRIDDDRRCEAGSIQAPNLKDCKAFLWLQKPSDWCQPEAERVNSSSAIPEGRLSATLWVKILPTLYPPWWHLL